MTPLDFAKSKIGVHEYFGRAKDDPFILECLSLVQIPAALRHDETPWCAAFMHRCLSEGPHPGTGKANARSYLDWGQAATAPYQPGDVVVFWRDTIKGAKGHVAFYLAENDTHVLVLGGNQNNAVRKAYYPKSHILGVRRAPSPPK